MNQRLFHVGLSVPETRLWDLLANLEKLGAGDLDIRHIPEPVPVQLDDVDSQPPAPVKIKGPNQKIVLAAMQPEIPTKPRALSAPTGLTLKQIHMALWHLMQLGAVKRPRTGLYVRIAL